MHTGRRAGGEEEGGTGDQRCPGGSKVLLNALKTIVFGNNLHVVSIGMAYSKQKKTFGLHEVTKTFAPMEGETVLVTSCKPKVFLSVLNRPQLLKTQ